MRRRAPEWVMRVLAKRLELAYETGNGGRGLYKEAPYTVSYDDDTGEVIIRPFLHCERNCVLPEALISYWWNTGRSLSFIEKMYHLYREQALRDLEAIERDRIGEIFRAQRERRKKTDHTQKYVEFAEDWVRDHRRLFRNPFTVFPGGL
jgi:hypothetical protein